MYDTRAVCPEAKAYELIECCRQMGVKSIELTGGGEPTSYPYFDEVVRRIGESGMDLALVTNGTLLTTNRAILLGDARFIWARVSIDAGTMADYVATRYVAESHWQKAWRGVELLANQAMRGDAHPEATVGVGFVIDRTNWRHVYEACRLAKEHGAHNIRISASFTPDRLSRFDVECRESVPEQLARAKADFDAETFHVYDLAAERFDNLVAGKQTYPYCYWKEVGCVVGADMNIYACCSWSYNEAGLMGTMADKTFAESWYGEAWHWRQKHDPRRDCRIHCLYQQRNLEALRLMGDPNYAEQTLREERPAHVNFV
jgi:sulfatase maturation enzyme AslB (radical SAM superfamily)